MDPFGKRKIESEMDRFEAEISSLGRPPQMGGGPAFIPTQLRRHPAPGGMAGGPSGMIAAPPAINRPRLPQAAVISGAPQVYRAPSIRPRIPLIPQSTIQKGVRPGIRAPADGVIAAAPSLITRPPALNPGVATTRSLNSAPPGFIPATMQPPGQLPGAALPGVGGMPIVAAPVITTTPIESIPLPPELPSSSSTDSKPSTSTGDGGVDKDDKGKGNKKKKEKKNRKLVRSAGGSVWEDPSLQDWDPKDYRIFCGDLGNDVTDEVLTRVFGRYQSFQKARVIRDKRTNKTKGYGFVSFKDPNDFVRAVKELDGRYVGSRPIKLRKSNWKNRNLDVVRKRDTERMQLLGINTKKPKY